MGDYISSIASWYIPSVNSILCGATINYIVSGAGIWVFIEINGLSPIMSKAHVFAESEVMNH